ncbi:MAG: hypothetical protein Q8O88_03110 [bacterium]|nr:hypothetical protein [bacterium]
MKILLKILNRFFVVLGVLFFIILLGILYLFVVDPFNLKPLLSSFDVSPAQVMDVMKNTTPSDGTTQTTNPLISPEQAKILKSIGVNPDTLPTEMTPELEKCLIGKVGAVRADEIVKGAEPTPLDFLKASSCLKQ